jgi:hypothetical protein
MLTSSASVAVKCSSAAVAARFEIGGKYALPEAQAGLRRRSNTILWRAASSLVLPLGCSLTNEEIRQLMGADAVRHGGRRGERLRVWTMNFFRFGFVLGDSQHQGDDPVADCGRVDVESHRPGHLTGPPLMSVTQIGSQAAVAYSQDVGAVFGAALTAPSVPG